MRRHFLKETLATGIATAVLLGGCALAHTEPKPTKPNGTIEQVGHNIGASDELAKLALGQTFSFPLGSSETVHVYNYTTTEVDEGRFRNLLKVFQSQVAQGASRTLTIYPDGIKKPKTVTTNETALSVTEADFVLIPPNTKLPASFYTNYPDGEKSGFDAATKHFKVNNTSQTISVITQPTYSNGVPANFFLGGGLTIEACMATETATSTDPTEQIDDLLIQETKCNYLGTAATSAALGDTYGHYRRYMSSLGTNTVETPSGKYPVSPFTISKIEYAGLQQVFD